MGVDYFEAAIVDLRKQASKRSSNQFLVNSYYKEGFHHKYDCKSLISQISKD